MKTWQQIAEITSGLKWIICTSLLISGLLFFPDQVRELYRVTADESIASFITEFASLLMISLVLWSGAAQIVGALSRQAQAPYGTVPAYLLRYFPVALATLPLLSAALGQFLSIPVLHTADPPKVGTVIRIEQMALTSVGGYLWWYGIILTVAGTLLVTALLLTHKRAISAAKTINDKYFSRKIFLLATASLIVAITAVFILFPVAVPQATGAFGILAVFTVCITAVCVHLSLLTTKHRFPIIPLLLIYAAIIAYFDLNDDHFVRETKFPTSQSKRLSGDEAFLSWLDRHISASARGLTVSGASAGEPFPVFIVAAQGGGIYAAYNAAVFLSRMEDLCPDFHNHVFAISSVSGGSIGAATFAATLDAIKKTVPIAASLSDPCPSITRFLASAHPSDKLNSIGPHEKFSNQILSNDLLSPLIAATLFPDFMQWFVPHPFGILDRARALEYALESAADAIYPAVLGEEAAHPGAPVMPQNILKQSYSSHWDLRKEVPALIMNATDTATGKRVIIAPFAVGSDSDWSADFCPLFASEHDKQFFLSTAAFVSARFPWISPAATTEIVNSCMGQSATKPIVKTRLVDGGYIDNSGVETALALIAQIKRLAAQRHIEKSFRIYLISLSGGDFDDSHIYSLGELAEPVRALLNGRQARTYIALNRASSELVAGNDVPAFNRTRLQNNFYSLPLGWTLSAKTREVIALESGRFWDCVAGSGFQQTDNRQSNADCVQLQIYHLLNHSAPSALDELKKAYDVDQEVLSSTHNTLKSELDHQALLQCYENAWWGPRHRESMQYLAFYQARYVEDMLNEWDRRASIASVSHDMLAYILGSVSHDSSDFRRTTDNLSFSSVARLWRTWGPTIERINDKRANMTPPGEHVDPGTLLNNPKGLAELVWGWEGNHFGNNFRNGQYDKSLMEGAKYRERGIYQKVGRDQYVEAAQWLKADDAEFPIDIVSNPEALSNRTVSARAAFSHFVHWKSPPSGSSTGPSAARIVRGLKDMTLADVFAKYPGDFEAARLNQSDMAEPGDLDDVKARSEMFRGCIQQSLVK